MEILSFTDPGEFFSLTKEELLKSEALNNMMIGCLFLAIGNKDSNFKGWVVKIGKKIVGMAIQTSLKPFLILSNFTEDAIDFFSNQFKEKINEVTGDSEISNRFVTRFCDLTGMQYQLAMTNGVYELVEISKDLVLPKGNLIKANEDQKDLALKFVKGFMDECYPKSGYQKENYRDARDRIYLRDSLYFWEDEAGQIVSMASNNRNGPNVANISWVFTPKDQRGKGFGLAAVTELSRLLLNSGKTFCSLYTDYSNPISNKLYEKVGYKAVGFSKHYYILDQNLSLF